MTKKQVVYRALERCGRLAIGQTPSSTLETRGDEAFAQAYAKLDDFGIVDWLEADDVPDKYAFHFIAMIAYALCGPLRVSPETKQEIAADALSAEREIRRMYANAHVSTDIKVTDY